MRNRAEAARVARIAVVELRPSETTNPKIAVTWQRPRSKDPLPDVSLVIPCNRRAGRFVLESVLRTMPAHFNCEVVAVISGSRRPGSVLSRGRILV